jgi:ABC-type glutathione transport system ATPase component
MIIEAVDLSKEFRVEKGMFSPEAAKIPALDGVSFTLEEFTTLGIVGESGSGKTTLAKILLRLIPASSGTVTVNEAYIKDFRKDVQIVFQNPYNSLDPKMRIKEALYEPLFIHKICPVKAMRQRALGLLKTVGMDESALDRYPAQFSGGQRQRICIARALACEPKLLVLDEPISSLDLTIQAKLLELFIDLKRELGLSYIFISHNLAVIKHIADSVIVLYNGKVVEKGTVQQLFRSPRQEYTRSLLEAAR